MTDRIAITGASGYVGQRLLELALAQGWAITALGRRRPAGFDVDFMPFELGAAEIEGDLSACTACIHLAADISGAHTSESEEIASAERLLKRFSAAHQRFIFVSSQAAAPDAPSRYGRVKWAIEQRVGMRSIIVRPGMVYGGSARGLFGQLCKAVDRIFVLSPWPSPEVQPVHVDELCTALLVIASAPSPPASVNLATPQPIAFSDYLRSIASVRNGRSIVLIPVPVRPLVLALRCLARLAPALERMGSRLNSLAALRPMETTSFWQELGISPLPLWEGLQWRPARRRLLAREATAFLGHCIGGGPHSSLIRLYVRACEALKLAPMPRLFSRRLTIRIYDIPLFRGLCASLPHAPDVRRRLDIALALSEASPAYAGLFIKQRPSPPAAAWAQLVGIVLIEAASACLFGLLLILAAGAARLAKVKAR